MQRAFSLGIQLATTLPPDSHPEEHGWIVGRDASCTGFARKHWLGAAVAERCSRGLFEILEPRPGRNWARRPNSPQHLFVLFSAISTEPALLELGPRVLLFERNFQKKRSGKNPTTSMHKNKRFRAGWNLERSHVGRQLNSQ